MKRDEVVSKSRAGRGSVLACLLAAGVGAQSVVPAAFQASEASGSTNVPYGRSSGMTVQMVYHPSLFGGPTAISEVAFRVDGGLPAAAKMADFEIAMCTSAQPLTRVSSSFAANRGQDFLTVRTRRIETLPAVAGGGSPNGFDVVFTLDQAFPYDPAQGALLVEVVVHSQQPGPYTLDTTYLCQSPMQPTGPVGCGAAGGPALRAVSTTNGVLWGRTVTLQVLDAAPAAFCVLAVGSTDQGTWNGWPLPSDLASVGAPGCPVSIDQQGALHGTADGAGTATFTLAVPNNPALQGLRVFFQGGAVAPGANPLGIVTSQAFSLEICGWEKVARVYAPGTAPSIGTVETGVAPVLQVR